MTNIDTSNLDAQHEAMAAESGPALPAETAGESKVRATSRGNTLNEVLDVLSSTSKKWETEEAAGDVRDGILSVLAFLTGEVITLRNEPRDPAKVAGAWFVGVRNDGSREAFKAAGTPSEKSAAYQQFKIVVRMHNEGAASNRVRKGLKQDDVKVFHRGAVLTTPVA